MRIFLLGGNGHSAARLEAARAVAPFEIKDIAYPGFEGRAKAADFDAFLDAIAPQIEGDGTVYATGIGGLLALCLRARGELLRRPLILQGAVLWGLERRWFPKLMRIPPLRALGVRWLRRRSNPVGGYRECAHVGDFFRWLTPSLLRELEPKLTGDAVDHIEAWWGGRDRVVPVRESQITQERLKTSWPLRVFPEWGHYPMIEDPQGWCDVLAASL